MSLPILNEKSINVKVKVPSGKNVSIQPWRVKNEKELLFAIESLDEKSDTYNQDARDQIYIFIEGCVDKQVNFDSLSNTDLLAIAMEMRKISKGDTIEYQYTCPHCNTRAGDIISITKNSHIVPFNSEPIIVNEDLIFNVKEIPGKEFNRLANLYANTVTKFNYYYLLNSIESIVYKKEIYQGFTIDELIEFVDQLSPAEYEKIYKELNEKVAIVEIKRSYKCLKCKKDVEVQFGDLFDFLIF